MRTDREYSIGNALLAIEAVGFAQAWTEHRNALAKQLTRDQGELVAAGMNSTLQMFPSPRGEVPNEQDQEAIKTTMLMLNNAVEALSSLCDGTSATSSYAAIIVAAAHRRWRIMIRADRGA